MTSIRNMPDEGLPKSISVIFPAYNEEENIRRTIQQAIEAMRPRFQCFELLIIDDGSTDNTGRIAMELADQYPEITLLRHETNRGLGESLYRGFRSAKGDLVIQNSLDYPLDLHDLDLLIPALVEADIVVAVRKSHAGYSAYRKIASRVNRRLIRLLFQPKLRDYNFTQLYKREVLEKLIPTSRSTVFIVPEILIRAHRMGFRIKEVDIEYHPRLAGVATSGRPSVVLHAIHDMCLFWINDLLK